MKKPTSELAKHLLAGLREARDYTAGKKTGAIVHYFTSEQIDAGKARMALGLSQKEFASLIRTPVDTIRKWESGMRKPSGPARTLLRVIIKEPKAVRRALG